MDIGRLVLRATVGSIFIEHGTQKLFGWFGGQGPDGTGQFFDSVGLRPGRRNALVAGSAEAVGGALITAGAATPFAAAAVSSVMLTALRAVIWRDGIKTGTGGYELLLLASSLALADSGPGRWSVDRLAGSERTGARWAVGAFAAAAIGSAATTVLAKRPARKSEDTLAAPAQAATASAAAR